MVIKIDQDRQRIGLSMKQLLPSPWDSAEEWIVPGETVVGHVTRVLHFGAFVNLGKGIEGLLHSSEIPAEGGPEIAPGDELTVRVLSLDVERQRVGLSIQDPASDQKQADGAERPEEKDETETEIVSSIDDTDGEHPQ
jgi:small subunit ribosomal protein S1